MTKAYGGDAAMSAFASSVTGLNNGGYWAGMESASQAIKQYAAVRDIPYAAMRPIAVKIADLSLRVGAKQRTRQVAPRLRTKATRTEYRQWRSDVREYERKQWRNELSLKHAPNFVKNATVRGVEVIEDHPLLTAVETPNPFMTQWALMYCTVISMYATGRAVWWLEDADAEDGYLRIWYMPSTWCRPISTPERPFDHWEIRPNGTATVWRVKHEDICYFPFPDPADPTGCQSPLQAQSRAVNIDDKILQAQFNSMLNGIRPGVVITAGRLPGPPGLGLPDQRPILTPEQRKQLIFAIQNAYRGVLHWGDPLILDGLIENVAPWTMSPAEMDFTNSFQLTRDRIFMGLGTNRIMAGEVEAGNRASAYVAERQLYSTVVNPLGTQISQVMTMQIAPRFQRLTGGAETAGHVTGEKLYIWLEEAKPFDADLRVTELGFLAQYNWLTPNEAREALDYGPLDGGDKIPEPEPPPGTGSIGLTQSARVLAPAKRQKLSASAKPGHARRREAKVIDPDADMEFVIKALESCCAGELSLSYRDALGEDGIAALWGKQVSSADTAISGTVARFLRMQAASIAKSLQVKSERSLRRANPSELIDATFNAPQWQERMRLVLEPHIVTAVKRAAYAELAINRPRLDDGAIVSLPQAAIDTYTDCLFGRKYWREIQDTTRTLALEAIAAAKDNGLTHVSLKQSIQRVVAGRAAIVRAANISQTESTEAINFGSLFGMQLAARNGANIGKQWLLGAKKNHRPEHALLHEEIQPLDGMFSVGGEKAPYPGYYGLSASMRCNCACFLRSVPLDESPLITTSITDALTLKYNPYHVPRGKPGGGQFTSAGGATGGISVGPGGTRVRLPSVLRSTAPKKLSRAERAKKSHKESSSPVQRHGEAQERKLAQAIKGQWFPKKNAPFDVEARRRRGSTTYLHAFEHKTLVHNSKDKITMHPPSRRRKEYDAAMHYHKTGEMKITHTIIRDDRDIWEGGKHKQHFSGNKLYHRHGVGAYRVRNDKGELNMTPVRGGGKTPTAHLEKIMREAEDLARKKAPPSLTAVRKRHATDIAKAEAKYKHQLRTGRDDNGEKLTAEGRVKREKSLADLQSEIKNHKIPIEAARKALKLAARKKNTKVLASATLASRKPSAALAQRGEEAATKLLRSKQGEKHYIEFARKFLGTDVRMPSHSGVSSYDAMRNSVDALASLKRFPAIEAHYRETSEAGKHPPLYITHGTETRHPGVPEQMQRGARGLYRLSERSIAIADSGAKRNSVSPPVYGQWNIGNDIHHVTLHEFGHRFYFNVLSTSRRAQWERLSDGMSQSQKTAGVSRYGASNHRELYAEAFSAYTHREYGKDGKRLPKQIEDFLKKDLE